MSNPDKGSDIEKVYGEILQPSSRVVEPENEVRPYVDQYVPKVFSSNILDAGCGNGKWSLYLAELGYVNIDAVDLFDRMDFSDVRYKRASIDDLPFADKSFDFCFSLSVVYHLDAPQKAFEEIFRVLRPGALFLCTVHTKYSIFSGVKCALRVFNSQSTRHLKHSKFESVRAYKRYLEASGFDIVRIDGYRLVLDSVRRRLGIARKSVPGLTEGVFMRNYKAWFGYHAILVARKPPGSHQIAD